MAHLDEPQEGASAKDGWNPKLNQDDAIIAQEKAIEREVNKAPLIGPEQDLLLLTNEYSQDDVVYQEKIREMKKNYPYIRKTRPDGNCFFRAFTYAYFESLLDDLSILERIKSSQLKNKKKLMEVFNDQGSSDYLVVFMRLLISGHLQKNAEFYTNFIEGNLSVKEFCSQEVEPMYKESDHIHVIALTSATQVPVSIHYLDRGSKVIVHSFPEGSSPRIHLLYRPGHYDVVYPTGSTSSSSSSSVSGTMSNGNVN